MAEGFGLAASAAGIVSLGLQVCEGVVSYVEGVKDRKPELAAVSKQANNLQAIVNALQMAAPRIDAMLTTNGSSLLSSLRTVEEELWALKLFLNSQKDVSSQSSSIGSTLKNQKRTLTYPFHRTTLEKLQKRLESANSALQISVQVADLISTSSISTTVSEIHTAMNSSRSSFVSLQSGIGSLESSISTMSLSVAPTQTSLGSMEGKLDLLLTEGRTENEHLERNFQAVHGNVGRISDKMQQALSIVQTSTSSIHETLQQQSIEIRQLQNLMARSFLQSAARERSINEASQATNQALMTLSQPSDGSRATANNSRARQIMGILLSKPGELKDAHDFDRSVTSGGYSKHRDVIPTALRSCSCPLRTITQHWVKRFGAFYASKKITSQSDHLPSCEFHAYESRTDTHVGTVLYTGFRRLLSASLELSFSWTSGAGGFSISPNITLRPMVDETKSPVFRLIELIRNNSQDLVRMTCIQEKHPTLERFLTHSIDSILRLYRSKECSPYDVNHEGQSVFHKWVELLLSLDVPIVIGRKVRKITYDYREILEMLCLASGASMRHLMARLSPNGIMFDYHGKSPLDGIPTEEGWFTLTDLIELREVATELCSYDNEIKIRMHEKLKKSSVRVDRGDLLLWQKNRSDLPIMAEIMELGPLSKSLMDGDKARLQSILDTDLSALEEKTFSFQTPFHLAALSSSPEPLKTLLNAAGDGSTKFDTPDGKNRYALEITASTSSEVCRNGSSWEMCTDCTCSLPFEMLQSSGWRLSPKSIVSPFSLLRRSSQSVRIKLISQIKRVREELRAAALQCLSPYKCRRLQLYSSRVLDGHMHSVVQRLLETDRYVLDGYENLVERVLSRRRPCIYHELLRKMSIDTDEISLEHMPEFLFDSGFEDVDLEDARGHTPLSNIVRRYPIERSAKLVLWFLQHGAQMSRHMSWQRNTGGATVAHQILRLKDISRLERIQYSSIAEVVSLVAPLRLSDECRCACCGSGCTTTTIFFRHLWEIFFRNNCKIDLQHFEEAESLFQSLRKDLIASKSACDSDHDYKHDDLVRERSLDLNHGDGIELESGDSSQWETLGTESSGDDDEEISQTAFQQSVHYLAIFLQLLQVDFLRWDHVSLSALRVFTLEALEIRHTCRHEMRRYFLTTPNWGDRPPLCDEEIDEIQEEDHDLICLLDELIENFVVELRTSDVTLQQFLIRYWGPRMEGVLEDLRAAKMSSEHVLAAEQIGVIWKDESASEPEEEIEQQSRPPVPTLSKRFEAFMEEMDDIVAAATQTDR